jgi:hypothetical protein
MPQFETVSGPIRTLMTKLTHTHGKNPLQEIQRMKEDKVISMMHNEKVLSPQFVSVSILARTLINKVMHNACNVQCQESQYYNSMHIKKLTINRSFT